MLKGLNPEQRRAVVTTNGPLLVLAGAGTGKTRVVTTRIAHLLAQGVSPNAILAMTFTNKAAAEMRERVAKLVDRARAKRLTIGTFHSFCARVLRERGKAIGIPPGFTICDASDQASALKGVLRDLHVPETTLHPRALQAEISLLKNRLVTPEKRLETAADDRDHLVAQVYRRYGEHLRRSRTLDFDDLLTETLRLLREDDATCRHYQRRYQYLMVDEYQDTNAPQYEIVRTLAGARRNLCVVGDDDQSIYGWRGADVSKILGFDKDFPEAAVVRLETNYRSTEEILELANRVIRCNPARHEKTLRSALGPGPKVTVVQVDDEAEEANGVVGDIVKRQRTKETRFGDIAVLFRSAVQARALEGALRAREVPYVLVGGPSFFDRKEVRDVLAYLKLVANGEDETSLVRVVNCPPRGVGKSSLDKALAFATKEGVPLARAFARAGEIPDLPPAAAAGATSLLSALERLRKRGPGASLPAFVQDLLEAVSYKAEVERCYPDPLTREARWAGVVEILNFAENFGRGKKKPELGAFLESLALTAQDDPTPEEPGKRDAVTLMTLHAAKGLEFNRVYLVGLEEGLLPHEKSLAEDRVEEERRLAYVGVTRARRHLTLTHARQRARYGRRSEAMASRFLFEMLGDTPPKEWRAFGQAPKATKRRRARARR